MTIANYTVGVGPASGSTPTDEVTFYDSWTLDMNFDDGCTFSFTIPGTVPEAASISELDTDVWLYKDGILDQRLRIVAVNQQWGPSGEDTISVQAVCYRRLLATRYVQSSLRFDQVSQGQIIWQLIQHTQATTNGNLGITLGSAGPTLLRDRTYEIGQNLLDIIVDLSNVENGPTWEINANKQLVVSRADLYPQNPAPLLLGSTVQAFQRPSAAAQFGNVAIVSGSNQTTTTVIAESASLGTDTRGRWERRASYPTVVLQDTLSNHAYGLLTDLQSPSAVWQIKVIPQRFYSDSPYALGDFVQIIQPASTAAPVGVPAKNVRGQVLAIQIQQTSAGDVSVSLRVVELGPVGVTVAGAASDVTAGGYRTVKWTGSGYINIVGTALTNVDYLVVGGGGAGGRSESISSNFGGGGGGGGGVLTGTLASLSLKHNVTIGAGGLASDTGLGKNGGDTTFGSLFRAWGGGAGGTNTLLPVAGSSGGGAGGGISYNAPGVSGQGYAGGASLYSYYSGAGGGGAAAVGGNAASNAAGNGGPGLSSSISGSSTYYGSGGAGGAATGNSLGTVTTGGGTSGLNSSGGNGTDGLGGGGGGACRSTGSGFLPGGNGGSGVVILRWAV